MSLHFHAQQFNQAYDPRRLCNWEIPRRFSKKKPLARTGRTQIIANDRGHLLPGIPRPQYIGSGPWGHFIPTWEMPNKITRDIAQVLRDPKPKAPVPTRQLPTPKEVIKDEPKVETVEKAPEGEDPCEGMPDKTQNHEEKDLSYVPGDLTAPKHRPESYALLRPKTQQSLASIHSSEMEKHRRNSAESRKKPSKINPFACVYRNFEMAKKCAKENLEHHPLPDTVTDAMFRKLQMERSRDPGLALTEEARATGIGWKGYGASGPTQCTKLRVYRPKTCAQKKLKNLDENHRPGSCGTFDMKWRFIKQKDVTPIELAICWDMTPENPSDEPKRTTHIDGSNGSAAPAVFAMVHSPKQPDFTTSRKSSLSKSCDGIHGCGTIKSSSAGSCRTGCKSEYLLRPKTTKPQEHYDKNNNLDRKSISTNSLYVNMPNTRKMSKETFDSMYNTDKNKICRKEIHKSSPNLSNISCSDCSCYNKNIDQTKKQYRPCEACDKKCNAYPDPPKNNYKMAFKAGKLQENKSFDGTISSGSLSKTSVKVPKQKDPYAKRNYDINSLHPPFSIWKGASCQSYPEHWRLASIYQHSYKPVENRKKPLLASVYQ